MARFTYTAIDGYHHDGNEAAIFLESDDQIDGGNLLVDPMNAALWTAGNSATITQQDNRTIKLTNGAALYGYLSYAVATEIGAYYQYKLRVHNEDGLTCHAIVGTSHGSNSIGTSDYSSETKEHVVIFKATVATTYFGFNNIDTDGAVCYVSNIEAIKLNHYGVDESYDWNDGTNAASITNEGNSVVGFGWSGLGAPNTFASGTTAVHNGTYSIEAECNTSPVAGGRFYADLQSAVDWTLEDGQSYTISFYWRHNGTGGNWSAYLADSNAPPGGTAYKIGETSSGETSFYEVTYTFTFNSDHRYLVFREENGTNDGGIYLDSLSIKKTGNLVENGEFIGDYAWTLGTGDTISGGVLTHTGAPAGRTRQSVAINKGETWVFTMTINSNTGEARFDMFDGTTWIQVNNNITTTGTFYITFTADKDYSLLGLLREDGDVEIDNVTARRALTDLSSNADGLEVYGELAEIPVNYNSTTVALSNFSVNNYAEQPYSSNLDPGTGDFSGSCWAKFPSGASNDYVFHRDSLTTAQNYGLYISSAQLITFYVDDDTTGRSVSSVSTYDDDTWHHIAFTYDQSTGTVSLYIDGNFINDNTGSVLNTLTNTSAVLHIGQQVAGTNVLTNGYVAGLKLDIGNLWTAQQLSDRHIDEAVLFQPENLFSIKDTQIVYAIGARNAPRGHMGQKRVNVSANGTRETHQFYNLKAYDLSTVPLSFNDLNKMNKFLEATENGQTFTYDERGDAFGVRNPVSVTKISSNESISRDETDDEYRYSIKLQQIP